MCAVADVTAERVVGLEPSDSEKATPAPCSLDLFGRATKAFDSEMLPGEGFRAVA
jgi:hypothetical protein